MFSTVPLLEPTMSPLAGATITLAQGILRREAEERLKESQEQLRALAAHLELVREEERTRIARELHDEFGQALTALKMDHSSLARDLLENAGTAAAPFLQRIERMSSVIDNTVTKMQNIARELRPDVLDNLGLLEAVEWYADEYHRRSGIVCTINLPTKRFVVDEKVSTALFRVLQEALTNVARHAEATRVEVTLARTEREIVLVVNDNGKGISQEAKASPDSLGILGMSERVLSLDGKLEIEGVPGEGTRVSVRVPFKRHAVSAATRRKEAT